jgi:hypothetical protein
MIISGYVGEVQEEINQTGIKRDISVMEKLVSQDAG